MTEVVILDPPRLPEVDQFDPLALEVADLLVPDLEIPPASAPLAEPTEDRHRHREAEVLFLGDPAVMGQVQVGQGQGVNRNAPGLAVGHIPGVLGDVPLQGIDPERPDASRLVGPHVIAGDVERSPVGVEPVA
jgi:hypothetical protein